MAAEDFKKVNLVSNKVVIHGKMMVAEVSPKNIVKK